MIIPLLISTAIALGFLLGVFQADYHKAFQNLILFWREISLDAEAVSVGLYALYETVLISVFATATAVLISVPLAAVAAGFWHKALAVAVRTAATFMRAVPALLWAVLTVVMFGPGVVAGAVALVVYSVGYLTKLFYETFENVDRGFVDAMRAIGARGLKLAHLVYLQQRRQFITNIVFILEYNIRTATIIGFVGAGGVGYYIAQYINLLQYGAAATIVLTTFLFVLILEGTSYFLRRRF